MTELQFIDCEKCKKQFIIGIDWKDIRGKGSGGKFAGESFIAVGNNELKDDLPDKIPCNNCGKICNVISKGG